MTNLLVLQLKRSDSTIKRTTRSRRFARKNLLKIHQLHSTLGQCADSGRQSSSSFLLERDRKELGEAEYSM